MYLNPKSFSAFDPSQRIYLALMLALFGSLPLRTASGKYFSMISLVRSQSEPLRVPSTFEQSMYGPAGTFGSRPPTRARVTSSLCTLVLTLTPGRVIPSATQRGSRLLPLSVSLDVLLDSSRPRMYGGFICTRSKD